MDWLTVTWAASFRAGAKKGVWINRRKEPLPAWFNGSMTLSVWLYMLQLCHTFLMESMAVCRSLCFWQCVSVCQTLNASKWAPTKSALGPDRSPSFHLRSDSPPLRERESNFTAGWRPFNLSDEGAGPRAHVCANMYGHMARGVRRQIKRY